MFLMASIICLSLTCFWIFKRIRHEHNGNIHILLAAFVARPLGGAIFGSFADKYGRRLAMIVSIITYSVGTFLCGLSTSYIWLFIFRMIIGMGMAGEYACSSSYAIESWPKHLRTKASAFLVSGFSIGNILASQVIPWVAQAYGWRVAFFIGLAPVALVLYVRRHAPESEEWAQAKAAGKVIKFHLLTCSLKNNYQSP